MCVSFVLFYFTLNYSDNKLHQVPADMMAARIIDDLQPKSLNTKTFCILLCGDVAIRLVDKLVVIKDESKNLYSFVMSGFFFEITSEDDEDIEYLDEALKGSSVILRSKGTKAPKGVIPIKLTPDGNLIEGIGERLEREIGGSAHFLAKRIKEYRGDALDRLKDSSKAIKKITPSNKEGRDLQITQETIADLKKCKTTHLSLNLQLTKNILRAMAELVGKKVGEEVHESNFGQELAKEGPNNRGLQEARRVILATCKGADKLFDALKDVPRDIATVISGILLDVVSHIWGPRGAEVGKHVYSLLLDIMIGHWKARWAFPSALAAHGMKHALVVFSDHPSNAALEHISAKNQRAEKESELKARILDSLGKS